MRNGRRLLLEGLTMKLRNSLLSYFVAFLSSVVIAFMPNYRGGDFFLVIVYFRVIIFNYLHTSNCRAECQGTKRRMSTPKRQRARQPCAATTSQTSCQPLTHDQIHHRSQIARFGRVDR